MSVQLPSTLVQVVSRALSQIESETWYRLGMGGMDPFATQPASLHKPTGRWMCDCSGMARWCEGESRLEDGTWYSTTNMVADAKVPGGEYVLATESRVGHLLVFPALKGVRAYGHVGVVTEVRGGIPWRVVHCSAGNPKGHAIQQTSCDVFARNGAVEIVNMKFTRPGEGEGQDGVA